MYMLRLVIDRNECGVRQITAQPRLVDRRRAAPERHRATRRSATAESRIPPCMPTVLYVRQIIPSRGVWNSLRNSLAGLLFSSSLQAAECRIELVEREVDELPLNRGAGRLRLHVWIIRAVDEKINRRKMPAANGAWRADLSCWQCSAVSPH